MTNFLGAVHDLDAHRANHRFGCGKQEAPTYTYIITLPIGFATTNRPLLLQEIWSRTNRVPIWQRETWHQYIPKGFAAENLLYTIHLHSSPFHHCAQCAMFLPLLDTFGYMYHCITTDVTGCAMGVVLPWCHFLPPDFERCAIGMLWLVPAWCDCSTALFVAISQFCFHTLRGSFWGGRSDSGCTYGICYENWMVLRFK